jgi:hypothetical protein
MAIREIRMPDGTNLKLDEWVHYPLYSTIEFARFSKINLKAFSYTVGQQVPTEGLAKRTATEADTNQVVRGRTNHDEAMVVYSITYEIFGLSNGSVDPSASATTPLAATAPQYSRHNLLALQRSMLVELFVGANINKPQLRAPFSRIAQSIGPSIHGTTLATVAAGPTLTLGGTDLATGGRLSASNQWRLEIPIYIESDRVFNVRCSTPERLSDMNQDTRLRLVLDGMKRRPVA